MYVATVDTDIIFKTLNDTIHSFVESYYSQYSLSH